MPIPALAVGLGSLALEYGGPLLARWLGGDKAEETYKEVSGVVRGIFGTENPDDVSAIARTDPAKAAELKIALAGIADRKEQRLHDERMAAQKGENDRFLAALQDTQSARNQTVELAKTGSALAWGAAIVSFIVTSGFILVAWMVFSQKIPAENREMALYLVGQLSGFVSTAVAYWLGSSAGSARKDHDLRSRAA